MVAYRKELRIGGQVGSAHQKDRHTYGSLTHQIEAALRKGYKEAEIVGGSLSNPNVTLEAVTVSTGILP